jgi:hypothetical protein
MLATGIKLPGAVSDFNQQVVEAITLKFRQLALNSDYITFRQPEVHKQGLQSVGYHFISASSNLGITLLILFYMTKLLLISSNIILHFTRRTRCGKLRLGRHCTRIAQNTSIGSYFNFEMSTAIVQITSAFVYLRFSETYKSTV